MSSIGMYCDRCGELNDMGDCRYCDDGEKHTPAYTERDIIELACRAPACPEWFEPDMSGFDLKLPPMPESIPVTSGGKVIAFKQDGFSDYLEKQNAILDEQAKRKVIQWPKAYARMVLEAK